MTDLTLKSVYEAFNELKEEVKKQLPDQDKIGKIQKFLDQYEDQNAKNNKEIETLKAKQDELAQENKSLMESALTAKRGGSNEREGGEYKAFFDFLGKGIYNIAEEKKQLLRTDSNVAGGYLVPTIMEREILKNVVERSPMRQFANVRQTPGMLVQVNGRLNNLKATRAGEAQAATNDTQQYGNNSVKLHRLNSTVAITQDMLLGSAFDMEAEIRADVVEAMAERQGRGYVKGLGDAVNDAQGFTTDTRVLARSVDTATNALAFKDLIKASGELKGGYDPIYAMNRRTLAYLRSLTTTDGEFLWSPAVSEGAAATFNGYRYSSEFIDMDDFDAGSGAIPVVFADFRQGYRIYDRTGITAIMDMLSGKNSGIVEWTFASYDTGFVAKPEAFVPIRMSA